MPFLKFLVLVAVLCLQHSGLAFEGVAVSTREHARSPEQGLVQAGQAAAEGGTDAASPVAMLSEVRSAGADYKALIGLLIGSLTAGPLYVYSVIRDMSPVLRSTLFATIISWISGYLIGYRVDKINMDIPIAELKAMDPFSQLLHSVSKVFLTFAKPLPGILAILGCMQLLLAIVYGRESIQSPPKHGPPPTVNPVLNQNANLMELFVSESYYKHDYDSASPIGSVCNTLNRYHPNDRLHGSNSPSLCGWCKRGYVARIPGPGMSSCQVLPADMQLNKTVCDAVKRYPTDLSIYGNDLGFCGTCIPGQSGKPAPSLEKCDVPVSCSDKVPVSQCTFLNREPCTKSNVDDQCGPCLTGYTTALEAGLRDPAINTASNISSAQDTFISSSITEACYPRVDGMTHDSGSLMTRASTNAQYCQWMMNDPVQLNDNIPTFQHYICKGAGQTPITSTAGPFNRGNANDPDSCEARKGEWVPCAPAKCWGPTYYDWSSGVAKAASWVDAAGDSAIGKVSRQQSKTLRQATAYTLTFSGITAIDSTPLAVALADLEDEFAAQVTGCPDVTATADANAVTVVAKVKGATWEGIVDGIGSVDSLQRVLTSALAESEVATAVTAGQTFSVVQVDGPQVQGVTFSFTVSGTLAGDVNQWPLSTIDLSDMDDIAGFQTTFQEFVQQYSETTAAVSATRVTCATDADNTTCLSLTVTGASVPARYATSLIDGLEIIPRLQTLVTQAGGIRGEVMYMVTDTGTVKVNSIGMIGTVQVNEAAGTTASVPSTLQEAIKGQVTVVIDGVVESQVTAVNSNLAGGTFSVTLTISTLLSDLVEAVTAAKERGNDLLSTLGGSFNYTSAPVTQTDDEATWTPNADHEYIHFYCPASPHSNPSTCYDSASQLWPKGDPDKGNLMPCSPTYCWSKVIVIETTHPAIVTLAGQGTTLGTLLSYRGSMYCDGFGSLDPNNPVHLALCHTLGSKWFYCDDTTAGINLPADTLTHAKSCLRKNRKDNNGRTGPDFCGDCASRVLADKRGGGLVGTRGPTMKNDCAPSANPSKMASLATDTGLSAQKWYGLTIREVLGDSAFVWDRFSIATATNPSGQRFSEDLGSSVFDWEFRPVTGPTKDSAFAWWESIPTASETSEASVPIVVGGKLAATTTVNCSWNSAARRLKTGEVNPSMDLACRYPEVHVQYPGSTTGLVVNRAGVFQDDKATVLVDPGSTADTTQVSEYTYEIILSAGAPVTVHAVTAPDGGIPPPCSNWTNDAGQYHFMADCSSAVMNGNDCVLTRESGYVGGSVSCTQNSTHSTFEAVAAVTKYTVSAAASTADVASEVADDEPWSRAYSPVDDTGRWRVTLPYKIPQKGEECQSWIEVTTTSEDGAHQRRYRIYHKPSDGSSCVGLNPIKSVYG